MEANSPARARELLEWYTSVVRTRMHNDSRELLVFTRWHEEDLIGMLRQREAVVELRAWEDLARCPPTAGWHSISKRSKRPRPPRSIPCGGRGIMARGGTTRRCSTPSGRSIRCVSSACTRGVPPCAKDCSTATSSPRYDALPREIVRRANYTDTADTGDDYLCSMSYAVDTDGTIYVTDLVYSREGMEVTEGLVADLLLRSDTRTAAVESNNGGRGFARAVQRLAPAVRVEWFHQSATRRRASSPTRPRCSTRCGCRRGWNLRWPEFYAPPDDLPPAVPREPLARCRRRRDRYRRARGRRRPPGAVPCAVVPYAAGVTQYGHGNE